MRGTEPVIAITKAGVLLGALPELPGVYLFRGAGSEVLYVGKAKALRRRVRSYFRTRANRPARLRALVRSVRRVEALVVEREHDALVLEAALIRQLLPKYNQRLRGGAGFPYLRIRCGARGSTRLVPEMVDDGAVYFGPCPEPGRLQAALRVVRRLYLGPAELLAGGSPPDDAPHELASELIELLRARGDRFEMRVRGATADAIEALDFERAARLNRALAVLQALREVRGGTSGGVLPTVLARIEVELHDLRTPPHAESSTIEECDFRNRRWRPDGAIVRVDSPENEDSAMPVGTLYQGSCGCQTPPAALDHEQLLACARGDIFGPGNARLPAPPMLMFDRITEISADGGEFGRGLITAEFDIRPDLWFFDCHFEGDPVMPGCLGLDAMWQLTGFFLPWLGEPGRGRALGVGEVRFRGEVLPDADQVTYRIDIRRVMRGRVPLVIADGRTFVDGVEIYTASSLRVGLLRAGGGS